MKPSWPRGIGRDLEPLADLIAARGVAIGAPLELMEEIDSTNDAAKRAAKLDAPHGALFVAEMQSRGRGRQGRAWSGVRGESIAMSVVLRIACEPRKLPPVALAVGLAVRDAVARAAPNARATIKWPNDVQLGPHSRAVGGKVAGVLVEATVTGSRVEAVIVGVGVNVHTRIFPDKIEKTATSIALHADSPPDRAEIIADILGGIDRDVALVAARGLGLVHARITAADALAGTKIRTEDGTEGEACGIDLDGTLRVRTADGTIKRLSAGEVHLISRSSRSRR